MGCPRALRELPEGRITWRHDSILLAIYRAIRRKCIQVKKEAAEAKRGRPKEKREIVFVSGKGQKFAAPRVEEQGSLFERAHDWKFQFDLNLPEHSQKKNQPFPQEIAYTTLRPDGVLWSEGS